MSLLLDALNKADQERKRNETLPNIHSNHEGYAAPEETKAPVLGVVVIAVLLVLLVSAIYWFNRQIQAKNNEIIALAAAKTSTEKQPATDMASYHNAPTAEHKPATTSDTTATHTSDDAATQQDSERENLPTPDAGVANLYHQQNSEALMHKAEMQTPAVTTAQIQALASAQSLKQFANLPEIHDLPKEVLNNIPSMNYSEHNYNSGGGSVKINGNLRHVNEQISNGLVIDKILEDGMILHIDNYSFKMRALNSWVNM